MFPLTRSVCRTVRPLEAKPRISYRRCFTTLTTTTNTRRPYLQNKPSSTSSGLPNTSFLKRLLFGGPKSTPEETMAAKDKAQKIIDENPVAVFSKSYCPYCRASKSTLSAAGAKAYIIELDQVDDGSAIQAALEEITGQRTVPNIFINKQHIGGNSDLESKSKQLPQLLKEAGAV